MAKLSYEWHLRQIMATRGLFKTTDLAPLLADRGIRLSPAQVYRLVTQTPERLSLRVLMALCDALSYAHQATDVRRLALKADRLRPERRRLVRFIRGCSGTHRV